MQTNDKLMINGAIVIEKAQNGVIVRPHGGWWRDDNSRAFGMDEVKVFNDLKDFERWFAQFFPSPQGKTAEGK